jgi:hypothetical protein
MSSLDLGLMVMGIGLALTGVRETPRLNLRGMRFTGPPGIAIFLWGLLIFLHVL